MQYVDFKAGREIEWLELNLLKNKTPISKGTISSISDIEDDEILDSWISELEVRNSNFHDPIYSIENNIITPLKGWKEIPEYFLCVYYAFYGAGDGSTGTKLFEIISAHALRNYIDGEVYILGFPANKNLNEYLDDIAYKCLENRGIPANGDYKDDGVDVIGYRLFDDGRSGNFYVLLQCAAGIHWAKKKAINLNRWSNYIYWYPNNILCSISTVEYVTQSDWEKRVSDYGMILDRLRIYNFLYKSPVDVPLRTDTTNWCTAKVSTL